jgi:hypothetical protein
MRHIIGRGSRNNFDAQNTLLLINYTIFLFVSAGIGIFVNLYLWINSLNITAIIVYQMFGALTVMPGFMIMLRYSAILKNVQVYRFGIVIYIIFILTIIVLQQRSSEYAWLLGVESGTAIGFFYAGYNSLTYQKVSHNNRILFNSWRSFLSNLSGIIAPLLLGSIIVIFKQHIGYLFDYIILLIVLIYELYQSMNIEGTNHLSRLRLRLSFSIPFKNARYPPIAFADFFWSMSGVVRSIILTVFVYVVSGSTLIVSVFWAIVAISQTFGSFYARKHLHARLLSLSGFSNLLNLLGSIGIVFYYNDMFLILFGLVYGVSNSILGVTYSTAAMDVIDTDPLPSENQYHYIILREYILLFARLSGIFITLYVFNSVKLHLAMHSLIIVSSLFAIIAWFAVSAFYKPDLTERNGILSMTRGS